jgi:hypothetical protein
MKKIPLLLALLVVALGLYTLSGSSIDGNRMTANVKDAKEEVTEDPKVDPKEEVKEEVKEDPKADPKEEVKEDPKVDPKEEVKEDPKVDPKEEPKEDPKEELLTYKELGAALEACELDPSSKEFSAYIDAKIITQEEADGLWEKFRCGVPEADPEAPKQELLTYEELGAALEACEIDPSTEGFAAYIDAKIITQEEADGLWEKFECGATEELDPKTILATIEGDCIPGLDSEEMKNYLESKVVAQEDIKISWKTGNCDVRVKNREREKEMIASFGEKELTNYLVEKQKAVEGDYVPELIAKYVENWERELVRKRRGEQNTSGAARTRSIAEVKQVPTEKRELAANTESSATTESFATVTARSETPAPVLITRDKPIAIPFSSNSRSGGGGSSNDYRVDEETSEETLEILESISVDSCFSEYIRPRTPFNDVNEVRKWQNFLNDYMGEDLRVTGIYNQATQQAVEDFQVRYSEFVLEPWGLEEPTSFIYKTTRSMANYIIGCPEGEIFLDDLGVNYSHLEQGIKLR